MTSRAHASAEDGTGLVGSLATVVVFVSLLLFAAHVLVAHAGALRAQTSVTRSQSEARALCQKIAKQAQGKDKAGFKKSVDAVHGLMEAAKGIAPDLA